MQAYTAGDGTAFNVLYARHEGGLFRFVRRVLGFRLAAQADEVFQDCWLRIISHRDSFAPERGRWKTWAYTVANNLAMDRVRVSGREVCQPCSVLLFCCTTRMAAAWKNWPTRLAWVLRRPKAACGTRCKSCAAACRPTCRPGRLHERRAGPLQASSRRSAQHEGTPVTEPKPDLRDARLHKALAHAPDAQDLPGEATRVAILKIAENSIPTRANGTNAPQMPWWRSLWAQTGGRGGPWNAAFATVLLGSIITLIWLEREVPDARPDEGPVVAQKLPVPPGPTPAG